MMWSTSLGALTSWKACCVVLVAAAISKIFLVVSIKCISNISMSSKSYRQLILLSPNILKVEFVQQTIKILKNQKKNKKKPSLKLKHSTNIIKRSKIAN